MYDKGTHQWEIHASLKTRRRMAASAFLENQNLFVTGGSLSGFGGLTSTEIVNPDGSVNEGRDLPEYKYRHCMVTMHDGPVAILGGYPSSQFRKVYIYDPSTNSYTEGPSMIFDRREAACTLFHSQKHGNRPVILISGGGQTTSEIFDYTVANTWEQSK